MQPPLMKAAKGMRIGAIAFGLALTGFLAYTSLHQQPNLSQSCADYKAAYLAGFEQSQAMWHQWPLLVFLSACTVTGFVVILKKAQQQMGRGLRAMLNFTGYPSGKPAKTVRNK